MNAYAITSPAITKLRFLRYALFLTSLIVALWCGWTGSVIASEERVIDRIPSYPTDAFLHGLQYGSHDFDQKTFVARNLGRSLPDWIVDDINAETEDYYNLIDPDGKRLTLSCFKSVNEFTNLPCLVAANREDEASLPDIDLPAPTQLRRTATTDDAVQRSLSSTALESEVNGNWSASTDIIDIVFSGASINARYANSADLGFGRDMHCLRRDSTHVACYVTNYFPSDTNGNLVFDSPDSEDADAAVLQDSTQLVATVAMEYSPISESGTDPVVKFYVYDANGNRVGAADLDGLGARPVPQLCMMCHGGSLKGDVNAYGVADFRTENDVKLGSKFLPFDLATFTFSTLPGYTKSDQQAAFRLLNKEIVLSTNPGKAIEEVIDEMYENGNLVQIEDFVVPGWDTDDASRDFYRNVIAKSCRSCHLATTLKPTALSGTKGFPLRFRNKSDVVDRLGSIQALVCSAHVMPHSLVTYNNFWLSGQNNLLDTFGSTFGTAENGWISNLCDNPNAIDGRILTGHINQFATSNVTTRQATGSSALLLNVQQSTLAVDRTFPDVIEPILQSKCAWCHYPNNPDRPVPASLILQKGASYDGIMSYITPYDGAGSTLYGYVSGATPYMPKNCVGKYCLTNPELNSLLDWINSGAPRGLFTLNP